MHCKKFNNSPIITLTDFNSKKIPCAIIDDDPFIRDLLMDKLQQYFPEIQVVAIATNGKEGIQKLQESKPELVFLDVEMTDMTGFEMLGLLPEVSFKTIFITSYKHYAIKAIRFNALDYLLKPFDLEELKNAISRFKALSKKSDYADPIHQALINFSTSDPNQHILVMNTQDGKLQLALKEIIQIQGDRNYSSIHLTGNRKEVVSKTLSDMEEILDDTIFFRCHKSHLVHREHINAVTSSHQILLSSGKTLPISRRRRNEFTSWFSESKEQ